jgi:hypothetical protein
MKEYTCIESWGIVALLHIPSFLSISLLNLLSCGVLKACDYALYIPFTHTILTKTKENLCKDC